MADNGILSFCRYVIIPVVLRGDPFIVERAPDNGGNVEFTNYEVCSCQPIRELSDNILWYKPKGHSTMDKPLACLTGGQGSNLGKTKDIF